MMYEFKIVERLKEYGLTTVKIYSILEELHKKIANGKCKRKNIDLEAFTIFCNKCNRVILQFCPVCGSTKIVNSRFSVKCLNCGAILDNK